MIIKMKFFAVLCLAFVLSACGSMNSATPATPVAPVEWPTTPVGMTTQEFLNAFGVATSNASGEFFYVSDTTNVGAMTGTWYLVRPLFNLAINQGRYFGFIDGKLMYMPTPTEIAVEQARALGAARIEREAAIEAAEIAVEQARALGAAAIEAARIEREAARIERAQVVTLPELFQNFEGNHLRADANYLNKDVRVTGVLRAFESFWGEYYFVEIGGDGVIESFRDRSLIILLGRLSPGSTGAAGRGRYAADSNEWFNKADEIKRSLLNLTIGETYTFYCESPSRQLLSDTMNNMYTQEQLITARPNLRWLREKRGLAEQNGAYLCTRGEVIKQRDQQEAEQQREREITRQQELQRQAAAEVSAREQAETMPEIVMAYTAVIHDHIQRNWSRPPSARNDMTAVLRMRLMPTGDVVDIEIVRSSGDAAFDRAAETAIRDVGRFSELQGMPPRMFERSFRSLLLTF